MNLATIGTLAALIGSVTGAAFWLDDRHQHVDDAHTQAEHFQQALQLVEAQVGFGIIDTRIEIIDAQIDYLKDKPHKDQDDYDKLKDLRALRTHLKETKLQQGRTTQ